MAADSFADRMRVRRVDVLSCLGYALFLAANATAVWGGVFPFLPLDIQTPAMISAFFAAQASAFALRFAAGAVLAYMRPRTARAFHPVGVPLVYVAGWLCLIALPYIEGAGLLVGEAPALAVCGGVLIGWATASFFLAWQRLFAAQSRGSASTQIIAANVLAPVFYALLLLIPQAVTALLVTFVIMPVFALCCVLVEREVDFDIPMFADVPREHPRVYKLVVKDYWCSTLCVGSVAFSCGIVRALATEEPQVANAINVVSMTVLFLCALGFLVLWRTKPLRLNTATFFHVLFPVLMTAFIALPVLGRGYLSVLAACLYAVYGCAIILTMVQCAQASHDRGVNPVFMYGFVAGTVYGLHDVGFMFGIYAQGNTPFGLAPTATASLVAIYMIGIMFFLAQGGIRAAISPNHLQAGRVELVLSGAYRPRKRVAPAPIPLPMEAGSCPTPAIPRSGQACDVAEQSIYADKIAKQCGLLRTHFKLTEREMQIIEDIARGFTVGAVAEHLGVSENTVRTHTKRIYAKLDIHKKQQLIELVRTFDPAALNEG